MTATQPLDPSFESVLAFWEDAGVDVATARALARAATRVARSGGGAPDAAPTPNAARISAPGQKRAARSPVDDARARAAAATTLDELAAAIAAFDGCPLKASAKRAVFADGVPGAPIMAIGEAPGRDEDAEGRPFVGRAGQLLDRMFAAIGVSRATNLFITNAVFWRPPGNRTPDAGELAVCRPFVERAIELGRPKALILIGGTAGQAILKRPEGVMRLRGRRFAYGESGLTQPLNAMVILHPAYLLRRPQEKGLAWTDLQAIAAWLDELGIARAGAV
ncbi:MAG: uracil-DNA glycosylase [Alphaproteobacteria bacterium]|nr:uracil-DNA glycosylase [Alphaproteobacteria bacterium]